MGTTTNQSYPQLYLGTELNVNNIAVGQMTKEGLQGFEFKKNNSRVTLQMTNSNATVNTYYTVKFTKNGNNYSFEFNNETLTYTNSTVTPTYLFLIYLPYAKARNIKIKSITTS